MSDIRPRTACGQPVLNAILQQLPEAEFESLRPYLEFQEFRIAHCLLQQGSSIRAVYFLNSGVASMILETPNARSVEIGLSGCEDMVGLLLIGGVERLTYSVLIQAPGEGFRVSAPTIIRLLPTMPTLNRLLLKRLALRSLEQAQNAACNRLHNLSQRLARWLLLTHDRVASDIIDTTHDFLARMVGADRGTVSWEIADFENRGILERRRGSVRIIDRVKLEERSCECYEVLSRFDADVGLRKSSARRPA